MEDLGASLGSVQWYRSFAGRSFDLARCQDLRYADSGLPIERPPTGYKIVRFHYRSLNYGPEGVKPDDMDEGTNSLIPSKLSRIFLSAHLIVRCASRRTPRSVARPCLPYQTGREHTVVS